MALSTARNGEKKARQANQMTSEAAKIESNPFCNVAGIHRSRTRGMIQRFLAPRATATINAAIAKRGVNRVSH